MRIDVSLKHARSGSRLQRIAVWLVILALGLALGGVIGAFRSTADGTLSGMLRELVTGPPDDRLTALPLDVKFRVLQTLRERRQAWRTDGLRASPEPSAVEAGVRQGQAQLSVALSLLGPLEGRGPTEFGRIRVDVRGEGDFAGMRAFSLEDPGQPALLRELILYHELARVGGIAPRNLAVGVRINGDRAGTAVAVEQPSTAMLLAAHKPLGALVGWEPGLPSGVDLDAAAWLAVAQAARWSTSARGLQGTPQESHIAWAQTRLDGLRAGKLALEDALDLPAMAQLMALAELTGLASRVLDWQSLRWYLNPVTLKLEPVVRLEPEPAGPQLARDALLPRLLACPPLRALYDSALRSQAQAFVAPTAAERTAKHFGAIWFTLPPAAWQRQWLVVQQRAMRLLAAETVPVEPVGPMVFLPQPPTSASMATPLTGEAGRMRAEALLVLDKLPPVNCFGGAPAIDDEAPVAKPAQVAP